MKRLLSMNSNKGNHTHIVQCERNALSVKTKGCMLASSDPYTMMGTGLGYTVDNSGFVHKKDITEAQYFGDPKKIIQPKDFGMSTGKRLTHVSSNRPFIFRQVPTTANTQRGLYFSTCDNGWTGKNVAYVCKRNDTAN